MEKNKYDNIVNACSELLTHPCAGKALKYLNNRLSDSIQKKFKFGFFPPQLDLLFPFVNKQELIDCNLIYDKFSENQTFYSTLEQHNLILPYRDVCGNIIAIVGRSLLDDEERANIHIPKYKNTSFEKNKNLFGLFEAKHSIINKKYVYVVEGQFDCIQAHNYGIENIVALGSSNMSMEQLILLLRYTNNIYLLLDNDEAGRLGRERIIEKYGRYTNIHNKYVPQGFKDLDELLKEVNVKFDLKKILN